MNAVIAGSADFSFSTGSAITRAAAHNQKLVAIVELGNQSGQIIVLRKDLADRLDCRRVLEGDRA